MRKILTMLLALVSVVAMGQEVKVDTVAADSLTADTVKADTYVEQEGMKCMRRSRTTLRMTP